MTANELRLGNWILNNLPVDGFITPFPLQVTFSTFQALHQAQIEERPLFIEPIPLTPEIFNSAGFILTHRGFLNKGVTIRIGVKHYQFWYSDMHGVVLQYLHQLQNLYFALTGEELPVNMTENAEHRTERTRERRNDAK